MYVMYSTLQLFIIVTITHKCGMHTYLPSMNINSVRKKSRQVWSDRGLAQYFKVLFEFQSRGLKGFNITI